jgi:ankyrin repeat protein
LPVRVTAGQYAAVMRLLFILIALFALGCESTAPPGPSDGLHGLAERGETELLLDTVGREGGLDHRDVCQRTPLMFAAQFGRAETVRALLDAGAKIDLHEKGYYTALMLAAGNGHAEVVDLLAGAGANVNEVEMTHGWTALIWAAKRGHAQTVQVLLRHGADAGVRDDRGWTAFDWAVAQDQRTVLRILGTDATGS